MGLDTMILLFWMLSFKPAFSLSSFTLIRRFFSSSLLSAIRVVPCTYLRVLTFFLEPWFQLVIHPAQWPHDWKKSVFILIPKKGSAKECPNYHAVVLILHASKVMLKILQARLQQYMNWELPDVQAGFWRVFHMMYSAYKLNKQGDNIQPCYIFSQFWTSQLFHVWF